MSKTEVCAEIWGSRSPEQTGTDFFDKPLFPVFSLSAETKTLFYPALATASLLCISAGPFIRAPDELNVHLFFTFLTGSANTFRGLISMGKQGILELEEEVEKYGDWDTKNQHPRGEWIAQQRREEAKAKFANQTVIRDFIVGFCCYLPIPVAYQLLTGQPLVGK